MYSFAASDVNQALHLGLEHLFHSGVEEESRNGPVLVAPGPVCVEFTNPRQRVLYSATRDANPVFHVMEFLWFIEGGNNVEFPVYFNAKYGQYSDDGRTMWDSYGWRWRRFFGGDQLDAIVAELRANPTSRRCVLSMWNPAPGIHLWERKVGGLLEGSLESDDFWIATHGGKAVPCNTHAYFAIRAGKLNMTVCNRSNDLIFGMLGANAVHFSMLLEYLAARVGVPMGSYYQFTNNMHAYTDKFSREKLEQISYECDTLGPLPYPGPAIDDGFDDDLKLFMPWALKATRGASVDNLPDVKSQFFCSTALPMFLCWIYRKRGDRATSVTCLHSIKAPDWQLACREWIERRGGL